MITKFSKWILFISSYIPLYLIFVISNSFDAYSKYTAIRFKENYSISLLISNLKTNFIIIIIFVALSLISWVLLFVIIKVSSKSTNYKELYMVRKYNEKINEYILVYILPFISVSSNDFKELFMFAIIFMVIGMVSVKNDIVYINPILYLKQYDIYLFNENEEAIESSILISKYTIMDMKRIGNFKDNKIRILVSKLSDKTYLIKK